MQVKKNEIRTRILKVSKTEFLKCGYTGTTMRSIALQSGIATGNIYTYFTNKEEIFLETVRPTIEKIEEALEKLQASPVPFPGSGSSLQSVRDLAAQIAAFIDSHRDDLELILFKSQGSAVENFQENTIQRLTDMLGDNPAFQAISVANTQRPHSRFFFHNLCSMGANIVAEIVMHDVPLAKMEEYFLELAHFFFFRSRPGPEISSGLS